MKQLVTDPTRPESGSLIDHILVRSTDDVTTARVIPNSCSDHDLVVAETPLCRERRRRAEITVRSTRGLVPDRLRLDLLLADWSAVYGAAGTEEKWSAWRAVWTPVIDAHMPLVKMRPRHKPCPWLNDNDDLRQLMRERDLARREKIDDPSPANRERYTVCRNRVKRAQSEARSSFFLSSYRYERKTSWKDIRRFLIAPKGGARQVAPSDRSRKWADELNAHFATVGSRVAAALETARDGVDRLPPRPPRVVSGAFRVRPATLPELSTALQRMSASKACGADGITIEMLRMTFEVTGPHLLNVVNSSIVSGVLPPEWKIATVVPIHKAGSVEDPNNYRPVSILPTVAKLVESVVCLQLTTYLVTHNVLCDEQHGFRPGRSTESAMLDAVGYLMDGMNHGTIGCLTTADTSKAFDSVQHRRLLEKLGWYGIDTHWFENWLAGRRQAVRGGSGTTLPITHGVIQGSLIGPILFLIFTNDLVSYLDGSKIVMYADDVQFLHQGPISDLPELQATVESTVAAAHSWFNENCLKINPNKTDLTVIKSTKRKATSEFSIRFGDASIRPSPTVKVLGMTVDGGLTFEAHVSGVVRRCYATLGGLSKMTGKLPEAVKKMIVEMLIFPHLSYCSTVWAGCSKTQRHRLQKVINHCAQVVKGVRRSAHVSPLLADLKWPSLDSMIAERDVAQVHYLLNNSQAPTSLTTRIRHRADVSDRETRASVAGHLQLPRVRTEHARNFFFFRAPTQWNCAPVKVKEARSAASCRRKARDWLMTPN